MKRYSFQEMNISGFTFYDIIDTEDNCNVVYRTKKYCDAIRKCEDLNNMTKKDLTPVIMAILKDEEFLRGGIFQKEEFYAKKYNLTLEEISKMQTCIYYALHITNECYRERV